MMLRTQLLIASLDVKMSQRTTTTATKEKQMKMEKQASRVERPVDGEFLVCIVVSPGMQDDEHAIEVEKDGAKAYNMQRDLRCTSTP